MLLVSYLTFPLGLCLLHTSRAWIHRLLSTSLFSLHNIIFVATINNSIIILYLCILTVTYEYVNTHLLYIQPCPIWYRPPSCNYYPVRKNNSNSTLVYVKISISITRHVSIRALVSMQCCSSTDVAMIHCHSVGIDGSFPLLSLSRRLLV